MARNNFVAAAFLALAFGAAAPAQQFAVRHTQGSYRRSMVARSEDGKVIARCGFTEVAQGDDVTMHLDYQFQDGSVDEETTTFSQRGVFRLVRYYHVEKGPFFEFPSDFAWEAATDTATTRTVDKDGTPHVASAHLSMPGDLANGFVGTLLINVPPNVAPFRVPILAPIGKGRLIHVLISPEGERPFRMAGQAQKATVFRIHPELGGIVGLIAQLIGLQPKDVMVWVLEGDEPAVVRIVGQMGGSGPVVSSEMEGASFGK